MMQLLFTVKKGQISRFILKIARASSSFNFYFAENQIFEGPKFLHAKFPAITIPKQLIFPHQICTSRAILISAPNFKATRR